VAYRSTLPKPIPARLLGHAPRKRVGLLGGSFNPAHEGHRHISVLALKLLKLDEIWWLVSPQNPLKSARGMAPLAARLTSARAACRHPRERAVAIETALGTRYTADTIKALTTRFPRTQFVWLMGADNLNQITRWDSWSLIFHMVPVAVFDRPAYSLRALAGKAAHRFAGARRRLSQAGRLTSRNPPAWVFFHTPLHAASATSIRRGQAATSRPKPRSSRN
jgi:nicotinate-nucleotide adenylyltransferase